MAGLSASGGEGALALSDGDRDRVADMFYDLLQTVRHRDLRPMLGTHSGHESTRGPPPPPPLPPLCCVVIPQLPAGFKHRLLIRALKMAGPACLEGLEEARDAILFSASVTSPGLLNHIMAWVEGGTRGGGGGEDEGEDEGDEGSDEDDGFSSDGDGGDAAGGGGGRRVKPRTRGAKRRNSGDGAPALALDDGGSDDGAVAGGAPGLLARGDAASDGEHDDDGAVELGFGVDMAAAATDGGGGGAAGGGATLARAFMDDMFAVAADAAGRGIPPPPLPVMYAQPAGGAGAGATSHDMDEL
jgi:hypothetical protein